jgi:pimeloyl-ACP methyl ester carboxylesterase
MVLPVIAAVAMTIAMIVSVPAMQRGDSPEAIANMAPGEQPQEPPDYVKKLEGYSGHGEWVKYTGDGGDEVTAYIAFPEVPEPAPAMIVIHEIFGLTDWVRTVAHDLAEAGYVAIAPDLLSRRGGSEGADNARTLIRDLPADSITVDLDATAEYLRSLDSVEGESIGVMGFCWGGSQTFRYATNNPDLKAAIVCYGGAPRRRQVVQVRDLSRRQPRIPPQPQRAGRGRPGVGEHPEVPGRDAGQVEPIGVRC